VKISQYNHLFVHAVVRGMRNLLKAEGDRRCHNIRCRTNNRQWLKTLLDAFCSEYGADQSKVQCSFENMTHPICQRKTGNKKMNHTPRRTMLLFLANGKVYSLVFSCDVGIMIDFIQNSLLEGSLQHNT